MAKRVRVPNCPFTITVEEGFINVRHRRTVLHFRITASGATYHSRKHSSPWISEKTKREMTAWANHALRKFHPRPEQQELPFS